MISFVSKHWRGHYGLGRSFWVHTVLLSLVATASIGATLAWLADVTPPRLTVIATLLTLPLAVTLAAWQMVGLWRSAGRARRLPGTWRHALWPTLTRALVIVMAVTTAYSTATQAVDGLRMVSALSAPELRAYAVERRGSGEVFLMGALNDDSVNAAITALAAPESRVLTITSHGGLMKPAERLARHIRATNLRVVADGECASACTVVLAASPYAAITEGTRITFHRPEPVVDFITPGLDTANQARARGTLTVYRDLGIAPWAVEMMARQQYWTPTLGQLVDMGLLASVYVPQAASFVWARDYCALNPHRCAAEGPAVAAREAGPQAEETAALPPDMDAMTED